VVRLHKAKPSLMIYDLRVEFSFQGAAQALRGAAEASGGGRNSPVIARCCARKARNPLESLCMASAGCYNSCACPSA
jgi:hypothetical protein